MCNMCIREVQDVSPIERKPKMVMFDQLRGLKMKHNLKNSSHQESYQPDFIAVLTQLSRQAFDLVNTGIVKFRRTNAYAVLTRTTQPLHVVLAGLVLCCYWATSSTGDSGSVKLWKATYAAGVAIHIGAQFWMTFISGIVLYFSLPRHEFGRVQEVLFPVYFSFNGFVSFITLLAYLKMQSFNRFHFTSWLQITLLLATILIESSVRLYFVKPMLKMKHLKTQMEAAAQSGQEIGKLVLGELANCPHYMKILKSFRAHHSKIAIGNMITFGCSLYSIMILADSICLS